MGNDGAISIGEMLKYNYTITNINLQSNQIQNNGIVSLCKSLEKINKRKISSVIRSIDLSYN